jgi:CTP:molybdopterin cytidylyltransferase MocA
MFEPRVTAVIFEGGQAKTELDSLIASVRREVVLDTCERLKSVREVDETVLVTNYPDLAAQAREMGVAVDFEPPGSRPFHFGKRLREVIVSHGIENVIYMGGAAAPLLFAQEFADIAVALKRERNLVVMNNVQSADLVAFAPARAIDEIELPNKDNPLGNLLREIGMRRVLIPNSGRVNFDLDTPTDFLVLGMHPMCGPRAKRAVSALEWSRKTIDKAMDVLRRPSREVAVIGRVGPAVVQYVNSNMVHRMRVFSEERGMKALGREERGEVVSLLGFMIEEVGPEKFFDFLSRTADVAFIDSRVIFGHLRRQLSDWDRFQSDLGRYELIEDPWTREFTRCAHEARIPVVLGGHSLVAAGLWLMAEMIVKEREESGYRHNTYSLSRGIRL